MMKRSNSPNTSLGCDFWGSSARSLANFSNCKVEKKKKYNAVQVYVKVTTPFHQVSVSYKFILQHNKCKWWIFSWLGPVNQMVISSMAIWWISMFTSHVSITISLLSHHAAVKIFHIFHSKYNQGCFLSLLINIIITGVNLLFQNKI